MAGRGGSAVRDKTVLEYVLARYRRCRRDRPSLAGFEASTRSDGVEMRQSKRSRNQQLSSHFLADRAITDVQISCAQGLGYEASGICVCLGDNKFLRGHGAAR